MGVLENLTGASISGSLVVNTLVIAGITYLLIKIFSLCMHVKKLKDTFKGVDGPKRHWLYGNMHLVPKRSCDAIDFGKQLCTDSNSYYVWWWGGAKASLTVGHPRTVQMVMKTSEPKPLGFTGFYRFAVPWLGEGLLLGRGQRWARSRRLLTPAFHFDILKQYISVYNEAAELLLQNIERFSESDMPFEAFTYFSRTTLDVILRCAMSYKTNCQTESGENHPYLQAVKRLAIAVVYRAKRPWLYPDWVFYLTPTGWQFVRDCNYVHGVAEDVIAQRRKAMGEFRESSGRKYLDFLDILLTAKDDSGNGMKQEEIRNEVDAFMFAGHDTTASALSWIIYSLATSPEWQKKCQEEIDLIMDDGRQTDDILWSDLPKMECLTMCIKEGLRNHCPVPFIQREFTRDFELDGRTFPAGTTVSLHIYGLHHNANIWPDPMEYKPERFSKENMEKMDAFQFVPFSAGPRNCIGQHFAMNEEKVLIARLLRKYSFEVDPTHEVRRKVEIVMRSENGIMLYAKRR